MKLQNEYIVPAAFATLTIVQEFVFHSAYATAALVAVSVGLCVWSKNLMERKLAKSAGLTGSETNLVEAVKDKFETLNTEIKEASSLIGELGKEGDRKPKALKEENELFQAIQTVDAEIKLVNEKEKKRNWRIEGLAMFSELLRSHEKSRIELSNEIISHVVKYVDANQGALFLHENEDDSEYLVLRGCYAYSKKRTRVKKIAVGQGLVGQCYLEKDTIYRLEIPQDYVNITSGLGESTPANLVLVPLMVNDIVYGVMELATFRPLQEHQVKFLEQLAENITSVLATLNVNEKTQALLDASQRMTSELQSREEEMRQNMEELTATQEEMSSKQIELDGIVGAIGQTMGVAELDASGKIIKSNTILNRTLEFSVDDMLHKNYKHITGLDDETGEFLERINAGNLEAAHYQAMSRANGIKWLTISFTPIKDYNHNTQKILVLARDITQRKNQEIEFERLSLVADNTDNAVIITDKLGKIEYINRGFIEMTGYEANEVMGCKPGDFLQGEDTNSNTVARVGKALRDKKSIYEEILNYTKSGEPYWISMAINPVLNADGEVNKYISIQANITETKKSAIDYGYKLDAISKSNAIVEFDIEGKVIDANDNFLNIVGYKKDEVVGQHHQIFVTPEYRDSEEYKAFWKKLHKGHYINNVFERIRKDGKTVWLKGIYNPIFDINGRLSRFVKFVTDVTQEKILALEKAKQEIELDNQMEAVNKTIASVEFDLKGYLIKSNDIFNSVTGIDLTSPGKLHYSDIIPPSQVVQPQTEIMWQNLREGKFFSGEFKLQDNNGKELWLAGTFNPIKNIDGRPYKVMMYAQFVTREKEKQKSLTGIVNALKNTTLMMELNPDGTFKNGNSMLLEELGYSRLQLRKKPFYEFVDGMGEDEFNSSILNTFRKNNFVEQDLFFLFSTGQTKKFRTTFTPIYDLEDKMSKIVVIMIESSIVVKV